MRPTLACRSRSSTRRRTPAASVCIAAASRRRRCCTSPRWSTRRSMPASWGVTFGEPKVDVDKLRGFKQGVVDKLTAGVGSIAKMRKVKFVQGRATLTGPEVDVRGRPRRHHRAAVRAPDSRHRLAPDEDPVALARQPAHDGLHVGARAARRPEVAAGDRRRLHRPGAGHRLRDARQQGVGRRDDARTAARRGPRPGGRAREAAEGSVRRDHAEHQGREGRREEKAAASA